MNGHSESCKKEPGEDCYKWFHQPDDYTNATSRFVVVVGAGFTDADTDTDLIRITYQSVVLDRVLIGRFDRDVTAAGATTTLMLKLMPRRMLCPPDGVIDVSSPGGLNLVECCCLEKALAVL